MDRAVTVRAILFVASLLLIASDAAAVDPFEFEVYPYQALGMLGGEMHRAIRLVDIHARVFIVDRRAHASYL